MLIIRVLLVNVRNVATLSSLYHVKKVWLLQISKMRNQKLKKVKNDNQTQDLVATKIWWN